MTALTASSQVSSTIDNKEYTCWTLDDNRQIAYKLYVGEQNSILACILEDKIKHQDFLIMVYKQDSTTCRGAVIDLNTQAVLLQDQNKKQADQILLDKKKIKCRTVAMWIAIPVAVAELVGIIKLLFK